MHVASMVLKGRVSCSAGNDRARFNASLLIRESKAHTQSPDAQLPAAEHYKRQQKHVMGSEGTSWLRLPLNCHKYYVDVRWAALELLRQYWLDEQ
jgi:hypothetical protein